MTWSGALEAIGDGRPVVMSDRLQPFRRGVDEAWLVANVMVLKDGAAASHPY